jgi:predicted amidohydrolase
MSQNKVKAAVAQAGSVLFDTSATLAKTAALCAEAADSGAKLIVFPEAFLGGYPKGIDFGARVGSRSTEGREWFRRYYDAAIEVEGEETSALAKLAASCRLNLVIGVIERDRGTLYCSVLFFSPDGELRGRHRKLMPTAMERLIWGFGDGSMMPVVRTEFGTLGAAICWENYMPLFRAAMYAKGVNFWCAPTVDERESWQATMRHVALEGRCFVLSACQYLKRSDCPEDYQAIADQDLGPVLIEGGSVIVSPLGDVLAGPLRDGEGLLCAEIDFSEIARGKFDLDVVGHYARPDIFSLTVDERPKSPVSFFNRPGDEEV